MQRVHAATLQSDDGLQRRVRKLHQGPNGTMFAQADCWTGAYWACVKPSSSGDMH